MIPNVGKISFSHFLPQNNVNIKLTDSQKSVVQNIISKYNPSTITQDDYSLMMNEIQSSGISPNRELRSIIESAGFSFKPLTSFITPVKTEINNSVLETESTSYLEQLLQEFLEKMQLFKSNAKVFSPPAFDESYYIPLTDEQKDTLQNIISKYDTSSITQDSLKSLRDDIKAAGFLPNQEVKETLDAAGFDMTPPQSPSNPENISNDFLDSISSLEIFIKNFLQQLRSESISGNGTNNLLQRLSDSGNYIRGMIIDNKV